MAEEKDPTQQVDPMQEDYLEQIKKLKENSVDKSLYDKAMENNRKLLEEIVNGRKREEPAPVEEKVDIQQLRKDLYGGKEMTNLEYWQKTLALREAIIDAGKYDPFLPYGHKVAPTYEDRQRLENLVNVVQGCIERANGDSKIFDLELNRVTVDAMPNVQIGKGR